jgi:Ca2+-binding RTX toxin-like protein
MNGAAGIDTASYVHAKAAVTVVLGGGTQDTHGAGIDTLLNIENVTGSDFADSLTGGGSANALGGGLGNDTLTGGLGADQFVFDNASSTDTITDFTAGADTIVLDSTVFLPDEDSDGVLLPNEVLIGPGMFWYTTTSPEQHFVYNTTSGALYYVATGQQLATIYSSGTTPALLSADDLVYG